MLTGLKVDTYKKIISNIHARYVMIYSSQFMIDVNLQN